jgi:hypothetical protein
MVTYYMCELEMDGKQAIRLGNMPDYELAGIGWQAGDEIRTHVRPDDDGFCMYRKETQWMLPPNATVRILGIAATVGS